MLLDVAPLGEKSVVRPRGLSSSKGECRGVELLRGTVSSEGVIAMLKQKELSSEGDCN
jgi:hypothetical protein